MKRFDWLNRIRIALGLPPRCRKVRRSPTRIASQTPACVETLESRILLSADFGDAPDAGLGTGSNDYNTLASDNGPSHTIVAGLFMGAGVDGELDGLPNGAAIGDDVDQALPDDEDGLSHPAADLTLTIGEQPNVNVFVTNTTGSEATLYGWIDYNADGVFDNATERASVAVPDGTDADIATLMFPTVPSGFTGTTYARFRLSTDIAAADPTGVAADGEVEDYAVAITARGGGTAASAVRIAHETGGGPTLQPNDQFGTSVASLGDLDGDGIGDLAVGAYNAEVNGIQGGAVFVLFMNDDGTVRSFTTIGNETSGGPTLSDFDNFGSSLASIGDLNGDGVPDLAVGAMRDDTGPTLAGGALYVLFMNVDGTVASSTKIARDIGGGPTLGDFDFFGTSVTSLGDHDGDGITDLAVGGYGGDVHVLFMNADGTAKSTTRITEGVGGGPPAGYHERFGSAVASLGDIDGDGIGDLAVGAEADGDSGAVYILFLNADGTVKSFTKIDDRNGGGPFLGFDDRFGASLASLGDRDGDGITDIAVGAVDDDTAGFSDGAVHLLFLNSDGTVRDKTKITNIAGPIQPFSSHFGSSISSIGDLNGDGIADLAVGNTRDGTGGGQSVGSVHVLFMHPPLDYGDAPDRTFFSTDTGDYNTVFRENGPSHLPSAALFMGATVDGEVDASPNDAANGDDVDQALPDDEDGLNNPVADLTLTVGTQPNVNVIVTNTTGSPATLYGWIDYDTNGVFDNATERAG